MLDGITDLELVSENHQDLFLQLIRQLEKDFHSATFEVVSFEVATANELILNVQEELYKIITTDASKFSNLLYRVDVSEASVVALKGLSVEEYLNQMSFLILKREWLKVWIRNKLV